MPKIVYVTPAQRDAANLLVQRSRLSGRRLSPAVHRIAEAEIEQPPGADSPAARGASSSWADLQRVWSPGQAIYVERKYARNPPLIDEEDLRARADEGEPIAQYKLANLLAERGDAEGLEARADKGERFAELQLASLLVERGDLEGLGIRADKGDREAQLTLANLLALRGDKEALQARADKGESHAEAWLAALVGEPRGGGRSADVEGVENSGAQ